MAENQWELVKIDESPCEQNRVNEIRRGSKSGDDN